MFPIMRRRVCVRSSSAMSPRRQARSTAPAFASIPAVQTSTSSSDSIRKRRRLFLPRLAQGMALSLRVLWEKSSRTLRSIEALTGRLTFSDRNACSTARALARSQSLTVIQHRNGTRSKFKLTFR